MAYIRIDPLTFYAEEKVTDSVRSEIVSIIQDIIRKTDPSECKEDIRKCGGFLNRVADAIVDKVYEGVEEYYRRAVKGGKAKREIYFVITPADTRFPGFVNSLGDHMITTSAFAVSAALAYLDNNCGGLTAYGIDFSDRELLRGFVRVAALLHDIGKPPPKGHTERTKEVVYSLFKEVNEDLAKYLSEASSRHHYGVKYANKPRNFIEWIIAYADKASASSRAFLVSDERVYNGFIDFALRLQDFYDIGGKEYINEIKDRVTENHEDDEELKTYGLLSSDEKKAIDLASKLINAENDLCHGKKLLALFHFEVPSIKSYLNRGRELAVYAGYSIMIDSLIHDVSDAIKESIGKEVVISDEGGALLAVVPSSFDIKSVVSKVGPALSLFDMYNFMEFYFVVSPTE